METNYNVGYTPGNREDRLKHCILEELLKKIKPKVYIEFHSGAGRYNINEEIYDGSSVRALKDFYRRFKDKKGIPKVFLHEKNQANRTILKKQISALWRKTIDIVIGERWETSAVNSFWRSKWEKDEIEEEYGIIPNSKIEKYAKNAEEMLFLIDPTKIEEYTANKNIGNDEMIRAFDRIINKGANVLMYVPQKKKNKTDRNTLLKIKLALFRSGRTYDNFRFEEEGLVHNNIIVANKKVLNMLEKAA